MSCSFKYNCSLVTQKNVHCCHLKRFHTIKYNKFQYLHQTAVRVEFVMYHIFMELCVCLDGVFYAENGYGKSYRVEYVEHHSNCYAYRLNEKNLLQTLRLQTSTLKGKKGNGFVSYT